MHGTVCTDREHLKLLGVCVVHTLCTARHSPSRSEHPGLAQSVVKQCMLNFYLLMSNVITTSSQLQGYIPCNFSIIRSKLFRNFLFRHLLAMGTRSLRLDVWHEILCLVCECLALRDAIFGSEKVRASHECIS